ncbi:hypothetical protein GQ457_08G012400 [Hibiscus cannabinus]
MTRVRREEDKPDVIYETNSSKFTTVVHHGGSFYRTSELIYIANDNDVLEMVSKLPRNHYVHVYLEEVLTACSDANVEHDCNVEVSDVGSFEPEINVEVNDVASSFEPNFNVEDIDVAASFEPDFNVEDNDDAASFEPDCNVEVSDVAICWVFRTLKSISKHRQEGCIECLNELAKTEKYWKMNTMILEWFGFLNQSLHPLP